MNHPRLHLGRSRRATVDNAINEPIQVLQKHKRQWISQKVHVLAIEKR